MLSIPLSIHPPTYLPITIYLSIHPSIHPSIHLYIYIPVLCPSPGCQIRVQVRVITSESESSPQSPSPSPSPSPSQKKCLSPSHKSSSPHIQHLFIFQNMKTNNKNVSNVRVNSATRQGRYCLDSGVITSHDFWVRVKVKKNGLESESE